MITRWIPCTLIMIRLIQSYMTLSSLLWNIFFIFPLETKKQHWEPCAGQKTVTTISCVGYLHNWAFLLLDSVYSEFWTLYQSKSNTIIICYSISITKTLIYLMWLASSSLNHHHSWFVSFSGYFYKRQLSQ
jgi:hypothetical protein